VALIYLDGFEIPGATAGTGTTDMATSTGGTVSVQSAAHVRTGQFSLLVNPSGNTASYYAYEQSITTTGVKAVFTDVNQYHRFYFLYTALPASGNCQIWQSGNSSGTVLCSLRISSAGVLSLYDSAGALIANGVTTLSSATWYRIEVYLGFGQGSGSSTFYQVLLALGDGNSSNEIGTGSTTSSTISSTAGATASFGCQSNATTAAGIAFYYDDAKTDNAAFPGAGNVSMMLPNAQGTNSGFTNGAGTVPTNVNTSDGTTSYRTATTAVSDSYTCTTAENGGTSTSAIITHLVGLVIIKGITTGDTVQVLMISNGSSATSTGSSVSTVSFQTRCLMQTTDFGNSNIPWVLANVDSVQVGLTISSGTHVVDLTFAGIMVDSSPGRKPPQGWINTIPGFFIEA
jgi:hypothetical protein